MSDRQKFFSLVEKDEKVKSEIKKAVLGATEEVAKNNGLDVAPLEELSEEELKAVAGGVSAQDVWEKNGHEKDGGICSPFMGIIF